MTGRVVPLSVIRPGDRVLVEMHDQFGFLGWVPAYVRTSTNSGLYEIERPSGVRFLISARDLKPNSHPY